MKRKDLIKLLKSSGFYKIRDNGDHTIFKKDGFRAVQVPRHRELNELTANNILKIIGLK